MPPDEWAKSALKTFKEITNHEAGFFVIVCSGLFAAIIPLWIYDKPLIENSSAGKLLFLSIALMLPLLSFNSFLVRFGIVPCLPPVDEKDRWKTLTVPLGFIFSLVILYGPLLICHLGNSDFKDFQTWLLRCEVVFGGLCVLGGILAWIIRKRCDGSSSGTLDKGRSPGSR